MTHRQTETSREIRLWIGQVIIPVATIAGIAMSNPEVRERVTTKVNSAKAFIKSKLNKKEKYVKVER